MGDILKSEDYKKKKFEDISKALTEFEILCKNMTKIHEEVGHLLDALKVDIFKNDVDFESMSISGPDIEIETVTGFSSQTLKLLETHSTAAKTTGDKFANSRTVLETLNSSSDIKTTEITKAEIAKLSDNLIQLMSSFSDFRSQLKIKFDRLLSRQLKALGMPHNKRTLNKALETDFTPTLLATRKGTGIMYAVEFFRCIRDCHVAVTSLDSSLYMLYDEFSKIAECLLKYDIVLEAIVPPLEEAIAFTNFQRRVLQRAQMDVDSISTSITPHRKRIRFLSYLLMLGIFGFISSLIAFVVVLFLNVIPE